MRIRQNLVAAAAALAFLLGPGAARAVPPGEVFSVTEPVDATAASAAAAREAARSDGQRKALRALEERLVPAAEWRRLPRVDEATLAHMVQDFSVANERSSAVRYLADYTFRFRPDEVRSLLRNNSIPFAETASKPVVVLPVLVAGGNRALWDEPNPWRAAWTARKAPPGLVSLVVPAGDLADLQVVDAEKAAAADAGALAAIAQKYGADDVIVAQATKKGEDGEVRAIDLVATRYGAQAGRVAAASYRANANESEAEFLGRVAAAITRDVEEAWKRDNLLRFGEEASLRVVVPIDELGDWVAVRDRLAGVAAIRRTDIVSMSRSQVRLELHFVGDPQQLRVALAQRDLALAEGAPDWTLQRRSRAAAQPR
jgi:hypothetical protein